MLSLMIKNKPRGERIREARKNKFKSQVALVRAMKARGVSVTRGAVGNWELGGGIETDHLNLLAELTDRSAQYIWSGKGPKTPDPGVTSEIMPTSTAGQRIEGIRAALCPDLPSRLGIMTEITWLALIDHPGDVHPLIADQVADATGVPLSYIVDGDTSGLSRDQAGPLLADALRRNAPKSAIADPPREERASSPGGRAADRKRS